MMRIATMAWALGFLALASQRASAVQDSFPAPARLVAVGDIHGDYDKLVRVLTDAQLIDQHGDWKGGAAHLVQTGDVVDRGTGSRRAMDLLRKLEGQAQTAGGGVHALIGNHEILDMMDDLRYVSMAEFAAYKDVEDSLTQDQWAELLRLMEAKRGLKSSERRMRLRCRMTVDKSTVDKNNKPRGGSTYWSALQRGDLRVNKKKVQTEDRKEAKCPPGYWGHRWAFSPRGPYGSWILGHNVAVKVGDSLFLHAGISPDWAGKTLTEINDQARAELTAHEYRGGNGSALKGKTSPPWYRCLHPNYRTDDSWCSPKAGSAEEAETGLRSSPELEQVLRHFGVARIVMGHSIQPTGAVRAHANGKVILLDVGMSAAIKNGPPAAFQLEGGRASALHAGHAIELPVADTSAAQKTYLEAVATNNPRNVGSEQRDALQAEIQRYTALAESERQAKRKELTTARRGTPQAPTQDALDDLEEEQQVETPPQGDPETDNN
jgi:hypothetical protein